MTDAGRAIERVDREESLEFLAKMIRFKSYSGTPGESERARFMVDAMTPPGVDAFLQEVEPGRFNAIGRWRGTGGGRSLLFNGHLDTNPVTEGWTVDPWGGIYDDRFIYGIGVSNMKAGDAASFCRPTASTGPTLPTSSTASAWRGSSAAPEGATTRCPTSAWMSPTTST